MLKWKKGKKGKKEFNFSSGERAPNKTVNKDSCLNWVHAMLMGASSGILI